MMSLLWLRRRIIPSKALAGYVMALYLKKFLVILVVLVALLQSLDLLNRSDDITAAAGGSEALLRFISLRLPELTSQFIPFATLLAALFSFYSLAQHSEVTIMRASGLAPGQVVAPMLAASLFIAGTHIFFHDTFTVPASFEMKYWKDNKYGPTVKAPTGSITDIWIEDENQVIEARSASKVIGRTLLDDIKIYTMGEDGLLTRSMVADFGVNEGEGWTLYSVRRFDLEAHQMVTTEQIPWRLNISSDQIFARLDRPEFVPLSDLSAAIKAIGAAGGETYALRTNYLHRIAQAASSLLMPLVALIVGFGLPRGGARIARILLALGLGFSYFIVDNYMVAMGSLGIIPPVMATFGALAVFILSALSYLVRLD